MSEPSDFRHLVTNVGDFFRRRENQMKNCKACQQSKPESEFYLRNGRPYSYCKECERNRKKSKSKISPAEESKSKFPVGDLGKLLEKIENLESQLSEKNREIERLGARVASLTIDLRVTSERAKGNVQIRSGASMRPEDGWDVATDVEYR